MYSIFSLVYLLKASFNLEWKFHDLNTLFIRFKVVAYLLISYIGKGSWPRRNTFIITRNEFPPNWRRPRIWDIFSAWRNIIGMLAPHLLGLSGWMMMKMKKILNSMEPQVIFFTSLLCATHLFPCFLFLFYFTAFLR